MALRRCKECGRDVSSKADKCPNCGAPIKRKGTSLSVGCLTLIILVAATAWAMNSISKYQRSPEGRAEQARRQAQDEADQRAADARRATEQRNTAAREQADAQ